MCPQSHRIRKKFWASVTEGTLTLALIACGGGGASIGRRKFTCVLVLPIGKRPVESSEDIPTVQRPEPLTVAPFLDSCSSCCIPVNPADCLGSSKDSVAALLDTPDLRFHYSNIDSESDEDSCEHLPLDPPADDLWEPTCDCGCSELTSRGLRPSKLVDVLCESVLGLFHGDDITRRPSKVALNPRGNELPQTPQSACSFYENLKGQFTPSSPQAALPFDGRRRALIIAIEYHDQFWPQSNPPPIPIIPVSPITPSTPAKESRGRPWWKSRGVQGIPNSMQLNTHGDAAAVCELIKRLSFDL
ncbi:hypothetical protein BOTBODRAFT_205690 [Botryobasidium botryosum FD-172 SS1]|uniref:Uncharacterized protein n=1 Tax=Botryobasidium botryosum (strain FD-172 SS1) TaxID=930990 RepID=A0A067NBL5_BOTB1|nr:hypothetical protein BOTBODRAFT_205690 [Botryobasidium botryosum FD-172 SS1]